MAGTLVSPLQRLPDCCTLLVPMHPVAQIPPPCCTSTVPAGPFACSLYEWHADLELDLAARLSFAALQLLPMHTVKVGGWVIKLGTAVLTLHPR